jgi:hypothetical protein
MNFTRKQVNKLKFIHFFRNRSLLFFGNILFKSLKQLQQTNKKKIHFETSNVK